MPGIPLTNRKSNCPDQPWVISLTSSVHQNVKLTINLYLVLTSGMHEASPPVTLKPA
jgi:hypothetical protein